MSIRHPRKDNPAAVPTSLRYPGRKSSRSAADSHQTNMLNHRRDPSPVQHDHGSLWRIAAGHGLDRRTFLGLLIAGGAAGVFAACGVDPASPDAYSGDTDPDTPSSASGPWFKNPEPFIVRDDKGLETRLENLDGLITPNHLFFVRNNSISLDIDPANWTLSVEGDAVSDPLRLTYQDIRNLPTRTLISYLECAGNHRAMFGLVNGQQASGTQWMTGAISNGEWIGASLRDVLALAGIRDDARSVLLVGLDTESPRKDSDTPSPSKKPCTRTLSWPTP